MNPRKEGGRPNVAQYKCTHSEDKWGSMVLTLPNAYCLDDKQTGIWEKICNFYQ